MELARKLNSYSKEYWDFSYYRNDNPLVRYPATMVAPMQACIIKEVILADSTIRNVLDPFSGSGTVLIEGQKLGLDVIGYDINPLAILLTRVQLEGIPKDCANTSIQQLYSRITMLNGNVALLTFKNITKWFKPEIIQSLSLIRQAIIAEPNDQMRRFYWCCFSETVKRYSNTRSSTFKLHMKDEQKIIATVDESIDFFKSHVSSQAKLLTKDNQNDRHISLECGDSKSLLKDLPDSSIDFICTSPPYGDNQTTVTYGQYSILPILWIDPKDLDLWCEELKETFSAIDSLSLGGRRNNIDSECYERYIHGISNEKAKKVVSFFSDYESVFSQLVRVLKQGKYMIFTLGNRRVDNHEVRFDQFNDDLAQKYGMELDSTITRNIIGKRMPSKVSKIENVGAVSSISTEYVKVYRRL